jgi:hypothetical protein
MALSGKLTVKTEQKLENKNFGKDLKENLKACTPRRKIDRAVEVKCYNLDTRCAWTVNSVLLLLVKVEYEIC